MKINDMSIKDRLPNTNRPPRNKPIMVLTKCDWLLQGMVVGKIFYTDKSQIPVENIVRWGYR